MATEGGKLHRGKEGNLFFVWFLIATPGTNAPRKYTHSCYFSKYAAGHEKYMKKAAKASAFCAFISLPPLTLSTAIWQKGVGRGGYVFSSLPPPHKKPIIQHLDPPRQYFVPSFLSVSPLPPQCYNSQKSRSPSELGRELQS